MKGRVLYIEDEVYLARIVLESLERRGFEVLHRKDGSRIMEHIKSFNPDICLLDVMLPHIDGFSLGSTIRNNFKQLPILFISAKTQTSDVLEGFSSGGNDYVRKPFSMEELVVRIENQIRLTLPEACLPSEISLGSYFFYPSRFGLTSGDKMFTLSHREAQVLTMLCQHKNRILERSKLLHQVWGDDSFFNSRTLDVYIRKLREYLSADQRIQIITLKGRGYQFVVPESLP